MKRAVPLFSLLLFSCFSHPQPDWISSQPKTEGYWFGIGIVDKPHNAGDIREAARNKALSEISSQIAVEISSSFNIVTKEENYKLDFFAESIIKTRTEKELPEVEIVDVFDAKQRYYLLARLSQKSYYENINKKRRNAVKTALGLLKKAEKNFSAKAFSNLGSAMGEILPYLDIPIEEEYPQGSGKTINLYSYLRVLAASFMERLTLDALENEKVVKLGFTRNVELAVKVFDGKSGAGLENIPVQLIMNGNPTGKTSHSDDKGICIFSLPAIKNKNNIQYLTFQAAENALFGQEMAFASLVIAETQTTLKLLSPMVYLNISETNLGKTLENPYIIPVIMEFLAKEFSASFVEMGEADLIISGSVDTRKMGDQANEWGIYQVFGDLTLTVHNARSGAEIISKSLNKVQGSDFNSNEEAGVQALKKMAETIFNNFLPELLKILRE